MKYNIFIPAGNPTALVWDENFTNKDKININAQILEKHKFVEQVGFIDENFSLSMAGGEVCVNAIRSAAFCFCKEFGIKSVDINMNSQIYNCGIDENGIYVKSKFSPKFEVINLDELNILVNLGDISHIVNFENLKFILDDEYKNFAFSKLKERNLISLKACGFINLTQNFSIKPVVFVRDIDTLFYESACGSGSIAASVALNLRGEILDFYRITQPSGKDLIVKIYKKDEIFDSFKISGEVVKY